MAVDIKIKGEVKHTVPELTDSAGLTPGGSGCGTVNTLTVPNLVAIENIESSKKVQIISVDQTKKIIESVDSSCPSIKVSKTTDSSEDFVEIGPGGVQVSENNDNKYITYGSNSLQVYKGGSPHFFIDMPSKAGTLALTSDIKEETPVYEYLIRFYAAGSNEYVTFSFPIISKVAPNNSMLSSSVYKVTNRGEKGFEDIKIRSEQLGEDKYGVFKNWYSLYNFLYILDKNMFSWKNIESSTQFSQYPTLFTGSGVRDQISGTAHSVTNINGFQLISYNNAEYMDNDNQLYAVFRGYQVVGGDIFYTIACANTPLQGESTADISTTLTYGGGNKVTITQPKCIVTCRKISD